MATDQPAISPIQQAALHLRAYADTMESIIKASKEYDVPVPVPGYAKSGPGNLRLIADKITHDEVLTTAAIASMTIRIAELEKGETS